MRCLVLVNSRSRGIGNGLTYECGDDTVEPGMLVRVPLRKQMTEGIVLSVDNTENPPPYPLRKIAGVLGNEQLLSAPHVKLLQWMAGYTYCPLRSALTPFLPAAPWRLAVDLPLHEIRLVQVPQRLGTKQAAVVRQMAGQRWMPLQEVKRSSDASLPTIRGLLHRAVLEERVRLPELAAPEAPAVSGLPKLTEAQREAYEAIRVDARPSLLFGITGSGKTEVYAHLIADAVLDKHQAILLLPEILLTQQLIERFERLIPQDRIAVLHSRLTAAARRAAWKRIRSGHAALVIGSRSALFAPCPNLKLIIIDEEHEWTYKNEQAPRYHARETAEALCRFAGAKLLFGTATPSIEAWDRVKSGIWHCARLPERYGNLPLPSVRIIDLAQVKFGSLYPFSPPLLQAIEQRLETKEQSVLFLNRRGVASSVLCLQCRRRLTSPASQLPFTLHKRRDGTPLLLDHVTGATAPLPARCPACGSPQLIPVGAGTQKIEEMLISLYPAARILRADSDTLQNPDQMRRLLASMKERKADILLGTQSVVKGLDLPGVTLAAVLVADVGLSLPHFRAGERVFQLLTQLAGRSGRAAPGEVIIQTFRPSAPEVVAASQHRTEEYLEAEHGIRAALHYPPATQLIRFLLRGPHAEARARVLLKRILTHAEEKNTVVHTSAAPTLLSAGREWHVLLRGDHARELLPHLDLADVTVDVDPVDIL